MKNEKKITELESALSFVDAEMSVCGEYYFLLLERNGEIPSLFPPSSVFRRYLVKEEEGGKTVARLRTRPPKLINYEEVEAIYHGALVDAERELGNLLRSSGRHSKWLERRKKLDEVEETDYNLRNTRQVLRDLKGEISAMTNGQAAKVSDNYLAGLTKLAKRLGEEVEELAEKLSKEVI